ncbi:MAG: c-type cytochrome biogenesis protein CcmI [Pseudomonadota bacterium]
MSLFWILATALVVLALAMVLPALLRPARGRHHPNTVQNSASLAVLRSQLTQIDAELAAGTLSAVQHARSRSEIERRALEEDGEHAHASTARRSKPAAVLVGLAIPCLALGLYWVLGNPQAMLAQPGVAQAGAASGAKPGTTGAPGSEVTMVQIEAMVAQMAQQVENPPPGQKPDAAAWDMLARAYAAIQKFPEADRAYARAIGLAPANAQLLADRADVMALMQGQSVAGEPMVLVRQALALDPKNLKALALAGSEAFERKDFATATKYWVEARALAPPGSDFAAGLDRSLDAASQGAAPAEATVAQAQPQTQTRSPLKAQAAVAAGASISGKVSLAPALTGKVAPGDTVFIFARAAEGPRMPLAILRRTAADLPVSFTLDDSTAMSPAMRLSNFAKVVVSVRVSKSGDATPKSGDLVGQSGPLATGAANVAVTIDAVQP